MAVTLRHKRSTTPGAVPQPADLAPGELAVNVADKKWFTKKADGTIVCLNFLTVLDGGEITGLFTELVTSLGDNLADASGNILGF